MEVIRLRFPFNIVSGEYPPLAMALGYFDGVHLGHQQVILEAKRQAE
ncbi:MAG: adenylyltransferase/cytidyltransferase family protein, partial [Bacillus sp. (in: firmicutes)]